MSGGERRPAARPAAPVTSPAEMLAFSWTGELARAVYLPLTRPELESFLGRAVARLAVAARSVPLDLAVARRVGASLVEADILDVSALPATVTALGWHLPAVLADAGAPDPPDTALALLAAVVQGYSTRLRDRVLEEQETVRRAEVQARWTTEEALRSSEARFRAVFENAGIGIGIADMQGEIVDANRAFAALLGYSLEEFLTLRVDDFVDPHDAPDMWDMYREIIEGRREIARVEKRYLHRDGHAVWTNLVASLIRGSDGQPLYTVAMVEDVTGRRELQAELRRQAVLDPLTGLPNRALVHDRLADVFARGAGRIGVCYLDLDRFKVVNDRLGHDVGDALLVEVAARFDGVVSARGHLVARMGGDEFVVLVDNPSDGELELLAETLLSVLEAPVQVDEQTLNVSASIGLVEDDVTATSPADVLKAADVTLYWAKADGRNRWAVFDPERNARDMTRYTLAATLKQGLDRGEFEIEYQPIVDLADGEVHAVEALVRWTHPTLGTLSPEEFIDLAEETGSIVPLGRRVLRKACERGAAWQRAHPGQELVVSVNLAVRQAQDPALVEDVARILEDVALPPHLLQLELTETALLGPAGRPVEAITALAALGVLIAVDDFGTGYSNLSYLPRLPLHAIKLAGVLIDDLGPAGGGDDRLVTTLISLAHAMGLTVVAESVETPDQAARLREAGCDAGQGWVFGRPGSWEDAVGAGTSASVASPAPELTTRR